MWRQRFFLNSDLKQSPLQITDCSYGYGFIWFVTAKVIWCWCTDSVRLINSINSRLVLSSWEYYWYCLLSSEARGKQSCLLTCRHQQGSWGLREENSDKSYWGLWVTEALLFWGVHKPITQPLLCQQLTANNESSVSISICPGSEH